MIGINFALIDKKVPMITPNEVAQKLAAHFVKANYKEHAVRHIIIEINSLYYKQSMLPVDLEMKRAIIELVEYNLSYDEKCLKIFRQHKSRLLQQLHSDTSLMIADKKSEYSGIEQLRGKLSYVFHYTSAQVQKFINR
jgi:hypothetical protein